MASVLRETLASERQWFALLGEPLPLNWKVYSDLHRPRREKNTRGSMGAVHCEMSEHRVQQRPGRLACPLLLKDQRQEWPYRLRRRGVMTWTHVPAEVCSRGCDG